MKVNTVSVSVQYSKPMGDGSYKRESSQGQRPRLPDRKHGQRHRPASTPS